MAPSTHSNRRPSVRNIFQYDPDAPEYKNIPSDVSDDEEEEDGEAHDVLKEEEEREKLLAGGIFAGITKKGSIKIGKSVRGSLRGRRSAAELASGMGGKRLGMEEGGEFGLGSESEEEEEEMWMDEKEKKVCSRPSSGSMESC
jgi:hypothetical protein